MCVRAREKECVCVCVCVMPQIYVLHRFSVVNCDDLNELCVCLCTKVQAYIHLAKKLHLPSTKSKSGVFKCIYLTVCKVLVS